MVTKIASRGDPLEPAYLNNLRVAARGWGVMSGLVVSQKGAGANMSVDVATGYAWVGDTQVFKTAVTNVVVTAAHATYDRYDLVVINSSGTISIIDGTAAATSYANDYDFETNNAILLAEIYVAATDTSIENAEITDKRIISNISYLIPSGTVWATARSSAPNGWLLCDGSAINRTTYSALFTAIGTTYGVGDGSTTFNVPDLLGRAIIGAGSGSGLTARSRGDKSGEETHILSVAELATHNHSINGYGSASGGSQTRTAPINNTVAATTGDTGSGTAHNNMQPFGVMNYIIKI